MRKFLLSIFAVLFAFAGVQAQTTKTYTYDFSSNTNWVTAEGGSTNVGTSSSNKLADFYYKESGDKFNANSAGYFNSGYFLWGKTGAYIELPTYTGEKITNVTATSSSGHSTSVSVGIYANTTVVVAAKTWSTTSTDYSYDIPETYQTSALRLQITNSKNSQITKLVITTVAEAGEGGGEETPTVPSAPVLPAEQTFRGSMEVEITGFAADATVYYTTDESDPCTSATRIEYTEPFEITATTTVKAVAVNEVGASEVATAIYTLFVVEETEGCYIKVTSEPADWSGKYLVVYEKATEAYVFNGVDAANGYVAAITDGTIIEATSELDAVAVTIAAMESGYSVKTANGYIYGASGSNKLYTDASTPRLNTIEFTADGVAITSGRTLEFNSASNQMRFRYYTQGTQKPVQLYKFVADEDKPMGNTVDVTEAGYATFYAAVPVAVPAGVEAYIVKEDGINNGYITLTQVTGVLPANTGVILRAVEGTYNFWVLTDVATADVAGNLLEGTPYNKNIDVEAYVLGVVEGEVGLYKAEMTDGAWLNNANKAYLPASAVPNKSATFYGFDWEGTTGIDEMTEQRAESKEIYDLTGRRVENITAPGIYIVGGKKVLVK